MPEAMFLWAALTAYVVSGSTAIVGTTLGRRPEHTILWLLAGGLALHAAAIGLRWERLGYGPFITMFEVLSSNVWSLTAAFALAYWRVSAIRPAAAVVMPILFMMMAWLLLAEPAAGHLPPTYNTVWLWIHVGFGKVFLGSAIVATGIAGVILLRGRPPFAHWFARMPADARLDDLAYRFLALGFVFESLMLIAGAIWAQDAWGRWWAWDPLETWAFLTWLTCAFALHARLAFRLGPRAGAWLIVSVFVLAFLTFFGVPFVSDAPHKGAV